MSEEFRRFMEQKAGTDENHDDTGLLPPDDPTLATAYQTLLDLADKRRDSVSRVTVETAKNNLYTNETPKDAVLYDLILPLQDRGYLTVNPAMDTVWVVLH